MDLLCAGLCAPTRSTVARYTGPSSGEERAMSRQTRRSSPRMLQTVLVIAMGMAAPFALAATSPQAVRGDADALTQIAIAHYELSLIHI